MNASFDSHRSTTSGASRRLDRASTRSARHERAGWAALGVSCSALAFGGVGLAGCGAPAEDGGGAAISPFGGGPFANGQAGSGTGGNNPSVNPLGGGAASGGSTGAPTACTPGTVGCNGTGPEVMNPNTPITQPQTMPVAGACTANSTACVGSVLNRCDPTGTQTTTQDCAATAGGSCGLVGGAAACIAPAACTPGATCQGANTISTCGADGSTTLSRCPNGTNCTGAGQCTPVRCNAAEMLTTNNGSATVYWFNQGTYSNPRQPDEDINCSFGSEGSQNGQGEQDRVFNIPDQALFGALNGTQYENSGACGACVDMSYQGRNVRITVVDSCLVDNNNPVCQSGHIDLSRGAWNALTGNAAGTIIRGVSWRYVPCGGNVQVILKEPGNAYWNEFLVVNHAYPIKRAQILMEGDRWVDAQRTTYNYWHPPEGAGGDGGDMGTYRVRITDINDGVIEEQLALTAGPQGGSGQFACQP